MNKSKVITSDDSQDVRQVLIARCPGCGAVEAGTMLDTADDESLAMVRDHTKEGFRIEIVDAPIALSQCDCREWCAKYRVPPTSLVSVDSNLGSARPAGEIENSGETSKPEAADDNREVNP